ncbi:VOC family protein [Actinomadura sp. 7K507]|uniref:VOC family protein n=1 Tax=Actinomadura sp. 7K507 TaxID=2530365 RepID=UPI00104F733B|nr:VOC family protein [Actinomadura sp. 7K507]TDC80775.1 glyoxalase [Actinomadura sp. 7K507]
MTPSLDTIDIVVSDVQAAIAFYARLGLAFTVDETYPDHAGCDLPSGLHLMLDTEKFRGSAQTGGWTRPTGDPRTFLSFRFPEPGAVDAKFAELVDAGYAGVQEPWDAFWGMRNATVLDPDGNGIDLYCPLPAE